MPQCALILEVGSRSRMQYIVWALAETVTMQFEEHNLSSKSLDVQKRNPANIGISSPQLLCETALCSGRRSYEDHDPLYNFIL